MPAPLRASPVIGLSRNVSFGYGSVGAAPTNTEPSLGQAPLCYTGYAGQSTNTTSVANTACIEFNSRGVPSDPLLAVPRALREEYPMRRALCT